MFKGIIKAIKGAQYSEFELKVRAATAHEGPFPTEAEIEDIRAEVHASDDEFASLWAVLSHRLCDTAFPVHIHKSLSLLWALLSTCATSHTQGLFVTAIMERADTFAHLAQSTQFSTDVQELSTRITQYVESHSLANNSRAIASDASSAPAPPRPAGPPPSLSASARAAAAASGSLEVKPPRSGSVDGIDLSTLTPVSSPSLALAGDGGHTVPSTGSQQYTRITGDAAGDEFGGLAGAGTHGTHEGVAPVASDVELGGGMRVYDAVDFALVVGPGGGQQHAAGPKKSHGNGSKRGSGSGAAAEGDCEQGGAGLDNLSALGSGIGDALDAATD